LLVGSKVRGGEKRSTYRENHKRWVRLFFCVVVGSKHKKEEGKEKGENNERKENNENKE